MSEEGDDKTTAIVIGAGMRGYGYAHYQMIMPEEFQVLVNCLLWTSTTCLFFRRQLVTNLISNYVTPPPPVPPKSKF